MKKWLILPSFVCASLICLSSCKKQETLEHDWLFGKVENHQVKHALYVNGAGCLPCIQPALEKFESNSNLLMVLHPKLSFLESRYSPQVEVDWKNRMRSIEPDTIYFHLLERKGSAFILHSFQDLNALMEHLP